MTDWWTQEELKENLQENTCKMIKIKSQEDIELMRASSNLVAKTHAHIASVIKPGITLITIDKIAEEFIRDNGGIPAFKGYNGFPNTLCISPNEQVVHGIPNSNKAKDGDIISIDCGVYMNGFYGDSAYTYPIGEISEDAQNLLDVTKESLYKGIEHCVEGNYVGDIGNAIQNYVESKGMSIVRELVGHGIGKDLHESPEIPNYGRKGDGNILKSGMVLAIEPMVNLGTKNINQHSDGWTITTADKKKSAHFEHTVIVGENEAEILTSFKNIESQLYG